MKQDRINQLCNSGDGVDDEASLLRPTGGPDTR
jgi:hypothetical protein